MIFGLWESLHDDAELLLVDIFGHDLHKDGRCATVPIGSGRASLGTLAPGYRPEIRIEDGKMRCHLVDPDLGELNLSVTDVRLYRAASSGWAIDDDAVATLMVEMKSERPALLSVGLGRPWPKDSPRHWLQINNLHLEPDSAATTQSHRYDVEEIRKEHPNAYTPWTEEDEQLLTLLHKRGRNIAQMAETLGRQHGGIASRLQKLGLTD